MKRKDLYGECGVDECGHGNQCREDNGYSSYCLGCVCPGCIRSACNPTVTDVQKDR